MNIKGQFTEEEIMELMNLGGDFRWNVNIDFGDDVGVQVHIWRGDYVVHVENSEMSPDINIIVQSTVSHVLSSWKEVIDLITKHKETHCK